MTHWAASTDIDGLLNDARRLWERGRAVCGTDRVEVYVKHAHRRRVARQGASETRETGCAVRWVPVGERDVRHVACGGCDPVAVERAIADAGCSAAGPDAAIAFADDVPRERFDLETSKTSVDEEELRERLDGPTPFRWIEAGLTFEMLVGPDAWIAVRSRARSLALADDGSTVLARRGLGVPQLPEGHARGSHALSPYAAAPIVAALVRFFHGVEPELGAKAGPGWEIRDDPVAPGGLAGGSFDDAGFPTAATRLAASGRVLAGIAGRGHLWRRSYREPPAALPSTLVVGRPTAAGEGTSDLEACRVLPLGRSTWVLDMPSRTPRFIRTTPERLLVSCVGYEGEQVMTAEGVLTPALAFDGLPET